MKAYLTEMRCGVCQGQMIASLPYVGEKEPTLFCCRVDCKEYQTRYGMPTITLTLAGMTSVDVSDTNSK